LDSGIEQPRNESNLRAEIGVDTNANGGSLALIPVKGSGRPSRRGDCLID